MKLFSRRILTGLVLVALFSGLLLVRLDVFSPSDGTEPSAPFKTLQKPSQSWMTIYQKGRRIGVASRQFTAFDGGSISREQVRLQLSTLGVTQILNLSSEMQFGPDNALSSFDVHITSGLFRFQARGLIAPGLLVVFAGVPGSLKKSEIAIEEAPLLSGNLYEAAYLAGLEKDGQKKFPVFDPSTLGMRDVLVRRKADEVISVLGKRILTRKYCADFMGASHCAWLSAEGEVLKETGILGLSMEKADPSAAQAGFSSEGVDFTQIASIPADVPIDNPQALRRLVVKIDSATQKLPDIHGGRQSLSSEGRLTILREDSLSDRRFVSEAPAIFLSASPLVQSNHPKIRAQAAKIVDASDKPSEKLSKIVAWVYKTLRKQPVLSVPNALEVLNHKVGDCNEHAVLTAALLRAADIPARLETGLIYLDGRFYYHAWNSAYIGSWITVDSVFNQIPADVTHIRLALGEGPQQLDLLGIMGNIQLEVVETSYD